MTTGGSTGVTRPPGAALFRNPERREVRSEDFSGQRTTSEHGGATGMTVGKDPSEVAAALAIVRKATTATAVAQAASGFAQPGVTADAAVRFGGPAS